MPALTLADQQTRHLFRSELHAVAVAEVGYIEGRGNDTKYGEWFGLNHHPWCAMFASWVYDQAARRVGCENPLAGLQTRKGFAGVTDTFRTMKRRGMILGPGEIIMTGDLLMWDHDKVAGGPGHTGMVVGLEPGGYQTVEGNTNTAFSRTGGMVCAHHHGFDDGRHGVLLGVARPTRRYGR